MAVTRIRLLLLVVAVLCAAGAAYMLYAPNDVPVPQKQISIGDVSLTVEVADTELARERGLSGRAALKEGTGLLFVFEKDGTWGIWMKDMNFPIDIVWIDASGTVVSVEAEVSPDTYPKAFYPSAPARYVLEVSAGYAAKAGIAEGVKIVLYGADAI